MASDAGLVENVTIRVALWVLQTLPSVFGTLRVRPDDDDWHGRVLKTVFRHGSGKQALESDLSPASSTNDENRWLIQLDL